MDLAQGRRQLARLRVDLGHKSLDQFDLVCLDILNEILQLEHPAAQDQADIGQVVLVIACERVKFYLVQLQVGGFKGRWIEIRAE